MFKWIYSSITSTFKGLVMEGIGEFTETTKTIASVLVIGGVSHIPNPWPKHTILRTANAPTLENRIVFHIRNAGTCRATRV
ncbi:MAG: hypothetical protein P1P69_04230 [Methanosarcinaceae archaeon]|nr:hypothetical protein [Methanosarcinaceae archaeon]